MSIKRYLAILAVVLLLISIYSITCKPSSDGTPSLAVTLTAVSSLPILHNEVDFELTRIEIPWQGPATDLLGFTLPIQVGDVDNDGRNEIAMNLPALDKVSQPDWEKESNFFSIGVSKLFEWNDNAYVFDSFPHVRSRTYHYPVSRTGSMAIVAWDGDTNLVVGTSPWRTNRYGVLRIADLAENHLCYETICLGAVCRLDPVEIDGRPMLFASTWSNYNDVLPQPDLEECPNYIDMVQAGEDARSLVVIEKVEDQFSFESFDAGLNDTLLISHLPDESSDLYYLSGRWTAEGTSITTQVWQGETFVPVKNILDDSTSYILDVKPSDLNGDELLELIVLHGDNDTAHRDHRVYYEYVRDVHLDIYHWVNDEYRLSWSYALATPV
jgi:hypothetical protein